MSGLQYTSFCWSDLHYLHVKCPLLHWVVPHSKLNHVGFSISIWIFRQKLKLINNKFQVLHICNVFGDTIRYQLILIAKIQILRLFLGTHSSQRHFFNFRKFLKTIEMISEPVGILSLFTLVLIVINYFQKFIFLDYPQTTDVRSLTFQCSYHRCKKCSLVTKINDQPRDTNNIRGICQKNSIID